MSALDDPGGRAPASGSLLMRVPGRARPQRQAIEEFEQAVAESRRRYAPAFWPLLIPDAKEMFRWRIQLDCGCIHEVLTGGPDQYPDSRRRLDPITNRVLPVGEYWCPTDHGVAQKPYRDVVEWVDRRLVDFPGDPEESIYDGMDAEVWAKIRRPEPHSAAFWRVKLACGHYEEVCTDVEWKPEAGPAVVSKERIAEISHDFEEWLEVGWPEEGPERDHFRRMIDLGCPRPEPERACYTCTKVRRITGYQRIGPLVSRTKPTQPLATDRTRLAARIAATEAQLERLHRQLDELGDA